MQENANGTEARGWSVLFDVCAEALVNQPDARVIDDVQRVAAGLHDGRFDGYSPSRALTQRYYDRVLVPSGPLFLPLFENSIMSACETADGLEFGPVSGKRSDHVAGCYRAVGFDFTSLEGYPPAIRALHADSLASECAFIAFLKDKEASCADEDPATAHHLAGLALDFAKEHVRPFSRTAAQIASDTEADLYTALIAFTAEAASALVG